MTEIAARRIPRAHRTVPRFSSVVVAASLALPLLLGGCASAAAPLPVPAGPAPAPAPAPAPERPAYAAHPGFDTGIYPGEAALRAWKDSSPYEWLGYYLLAPCHRDGSWVGKREAVASGGWGTAVIYVGQQDWSQMPSRPAPAPRDTAAARDTARRDTLPRDSVRRDTIPLPPPACASANLTAQRAAVDAADAAGRASSEGFAPGSVIFLDVERVERVSPALAGYVRGWVATLLADGRYLPGLYLHRLNVAQLRDETAASWSAAGKPGALPLWITSPAGFSRELPLSAAGAEGIAVWQGVLDSAQSWGGVTLRVDENVAARPSPSSPF